MGKLIVSAETSLDGKIANPKLWEKVFNYHSEDVQQYLKELLFEPDALIMGRLTYDGFAAHWPSQTGEDADRINAMPKYVASKSVDSKLSWNAKLLDENLKNQIKDLKKNTVLLQYGIGELTQFMLQNQLIDELRLLIFPFTIDDEDKSFRFLGDTSLQLIDSQSFSSGAIAIKYKVRYNN